MSVRIAAAISTHNRRETAMLALRSALEQTHPPEEVFIVCDGCDDGTQEAARALGDPRVRVLDKPKAPGAGWLNRNDVLEQASAEVVAWLSDDDLWLPDHLERVAPLYEAGVADMVQTACVLVEADDSMHPHGFDWSIARFRQGALETGRHEMLSSAISHTVELGVRAGGWRTVDRYGDKDFWHRMLRAGARTAMLTEPTVLFFRAWERDHRTRTGSQTPHSWNASGIRRSSRACGSRWRGRRTAATPTSTRRSSGSSSASAISRRSRSGCARSASA